MTSPRRKQLLAEKLGSFVQEYARKAQKGVEPNDRKYSSEVEALVKHLASEELSELLSGDTAEPVTIRKRKKPTKPDPFAKEVKRNR